MGQTDILKTDFTFPDTVYIVGSGMSAKDNCLRIPPGTFVIACNRAIELPIKPSIWLVHDPAVLKADWFNNRIGAIADSHRDLSLNSIYAGCAPVPVFEQECIAKYFPIVKVTFKAGGDIYRPLDKAEGMISTRATVAGIALALCYYGGCKEVITLGVDMKGGYFNGDPHPQAGHDKVWPCVAEWEWLVKWVKSQGVDVRRIDECEPLPVDQPKPVWNIRVHRPQNNVLPDNDVHRNLWKMPDTVYLLASGPNGRDCYKDVPADAYVIAVNGAVVIPWTQESARFKVAVWVCADWEVILKDFWNNAFENFEGKRVFSSFIIERTGTKDVLHFFIRDSYNEEPYVPDELGFRVGGTVSSTALEIAWLCGARRVIMIGADMAGDFHFDGSGGTGDSRHGDKWQCCDGCDSIIRFLKSEGLEILTLSDTRLREPKRIKKIPALPKREKFPTVGYLVMAHFGLDLHHALIDIQYQNYPDELKTVYVLYQRRKGEFPARLIHDFKFKVVEIDVEGSWPHLWLYKGQAGLQAAKADGVEIIIWCDPDDRLSPDYTIKAIQPLVDGVSSVAWTYDCYMHESGRIKNEAYRSPIGALVGVTDLIYAELNELFATVYEGDWRAPKRLPAVNYEGARDNTFRRQLEKKYDPIPHHFGVKHYFVNGQANTLGRREPEHDVDYDPEHPQAKEWTKIQHEEDACTANVANSSKA